MSAENVTKEKYEYLFLDIEWNQEPGTTDIDGREPVQIAIVAADEELQKVKTFSKSVRLDDPTVLAKNTIKISHVSLQDVTNGKTKEDVMKRIKLKAAETMKDDSLSQAFSVMKKYSGADALTQAMVQELIEKVVVTDPEHVEIVWKFKDEVRNFIGI